MEQTFLQKSSIPKSYFALALPTVLSMVVSIIYNMADTWFIAQTQNTDLVAGVSLNASVFMLLMAFGNIFGQGGCSLISRLLGQGDERNVRSVSAFCFYAALICGVVIGAVMLLFHTPLLRVLGADAASLPYASPYFICLAAGAPLIVVSFIHSNLLRSAGLSTESMIGSVGGAVINIILDPILIFLFHLGAGGAAIATVLGYVFTDIFYLICVIRKCRQFSIHPAHMVIPGNLTVQIFGIGIPAALTNFAQSFSIILVNQALLVYGNDKIAAMGIALKVCSIAVLILVGFSFGGQPLIGYLYGAKDGKRLSELITFCFRFICGLAAVLAVLLALLSSVFMQIFMEDPSIRETGALMLQFQAIGLPFAALVQIIMILFQSTGKMVVSFFLSICRQGVVFFIVLMIAVRAAGYWGVITAQAAADVISAGIAMGLYCNSIRRELRTLSSGD